MNEVFSDADVDDNASLVDSTNTDSVGSWDHFWFASASVDPVASVRGLLCVITAAYFASCWSDVEFWYTDDGPLSPTRVSTFLQTGGLEDTAKWILSPLFLTSTAWIYRMYLVIGIVVAVLVTAGRGGRIALWALWLLLVGWANRAMIVAGLTETLLSLGLFASAIAPPQSSWRSWGRQRDDRGQIDWTAGFSERLLAVQITVVGLSTFVTMLAGRIWFNGIGAYAVAAPVEDRTIDWTTSESLFIQASVHETLTHLMVIALPLGFVLAWIGKTNRIGQAILILWCIVVALLGSHWLYASAFAAMVLAVRPRP
jgi:hypothetical protein